MTLTEFLALPQAAQEREERMATMIFDGGMSEVEAESIIDQKQKELFS